MFNLKKNKVKELQSELVKKYDKLISLCENCEYDEKKLSEIKKLHSKLVKKYNRLIPQGGIFECGTKNKLNEIEKLQSELVKKYDELVCQCENCKHERLELYKLHADLADKIQQHRESVNRTYLTVISLIFTGIGILSFFITKLPLEFITKDIIQDGVSVSSALEAPYVKHYIKKSYQSMYILSLLGGLFSFVWFLNLCSYDGMRIKKIYFLQKLEKDSTYKYKFYTDYTDYTDYTEVFSIKKISSMLDWPLNNPHVIISILIFSVLSFAIYYYKLQ